MRPRLRCATRATSTRSGRKTARRVRKRGVEFEAYSDSSSLRERKVVIAHSFARFKRHESRVVTGAGQPPGGRSRGDGARPSQDHEYEEGEARNVRGDEAPCGAAIRAIITPDLRTASRVHRRGNGRFKMPTNTAGCRLSSAWRSRGRDRTWRETRVGCTARAGM